MVDERLLNSLARLNTDPDFQAFKDELKRRKELARDSLQAATDHVVIGRAQGQAQLVDDLLQLVQGARESLARRESLKR